MQMILDWSTYGVSPAVKRAFVIVMYQAVSAGLVALAAILAEYQPTTEQAVLGIALTNAFVGAFQKWLTSVRPAV